jgi:hypothetical protein
MRKTTASQRSFALASARAGTNAVHVEEHIVDRPPLETNQSRTARASKLSRLE